MSINFTHLDCLTLKPGNAVTNPCLVPIYVFLQISFLFFFNCHCVLQKRMETFLLLNILLLMCRPIGQFLHQVSFPIMFKVFLYIFWTFAYSQITIRTSTNLHSHIMIVSIFLSVTRLYVILNTFNWMQISTPLFKSSNVFSC